MNDRKMVLVVDDDPIALEVAKERLERAGYAVRVRGQALGTSPWILEHRPDFVLLDVNMPALSGSELATLITRRDVDTRVILYSGMSQNELEDLVVTTGALGAVQKTDDEGEFIQQFIGLAGSPTRDRAD